jgi:hypothetical protein
VAKIDRYSGNMEAFAAGALSTERTIFGDTAQSDTLDANITADFLRGWGIVGVNENPTKQDFNGLAFTLGQLISYLHQRGIAEWNTAQEYFDGSVVTTDVGIYRLKPAGDGSSDPDTDAGVNWELAPTQAIVDAKAAISGQAFSGNISAPNLSGTNTGDQDLSGKADQATTYTKTEADGLLDDKSSLRAAGLTVTVGTGGDYPTINAALEYLSKLQPVYDFAGITATINLLTGFTMAEQVLVRGLDMGWVTITGADGETVITHTALTTDFTTADYGFDSYPAFGVSKGGVLPRIDQLFRFNVANVGGNKHGIMAVGAGSSADVLAGAGVNDAGTYGIYAFRGSTITAEGANASGAGTTGIYASRGSTITAEGVNASGAGTNGISAASGSTINAYAADASSAGTYGISAVDGSTINAYTATGTLSQAINTVTSSGIIFQ